MRTAVSTIGVPLGSTVQIAAFNEKRVHLCIATQSPGVIVAPADADASGFGAFSLSDALPPINFDIKDHGDVVTKAWNGSSKAGGTRNLIVIETFLDEK